MTDRTGELDLTFLLEQHEKEKWELKQQLSKAVEDLTLLRGTKQLVNNLAVENTKLKQRAQEAEGETSIVKSVGLNSPEMKVLQAKVDELEGTLSGAQDINEEHQRYNGELQTKLTKVGEDNKKLSLQINDYIKKYQDAIRKLGL